MDVTQPFSHRRPAAGTLPAFSLPPPPADIPRVVSGLSPSLSAETGSSQSSGATSSMAFGYGSHARTPGGSDSSASTSNLPGPWSNGNQSHYQVASQQQAPHQAHALPPTPYNPRPPSMFSPPLSMPYQSRHSISPAANGDGLQLPPYDQLNGVFQASAPSGGATREVNSISQQPSMTNGPNPTPVTSAASHLDGYPYTRPTTLPPSYYNPPAAAPYQPAFPAFSSHVPPTMPSPTGINSASRSLSSYAVQPMLSPTQYRTGPPPSPFGPMPGMGVGSVLPPNMSQPGGQMPVLPHSMGHAGFGHQPMFGHPQPPHVQVERPFKCDQCNQSFSRNHDLKRHKRIHLSVKPFPCEYCSKSFSRKDALKRHRLVKNCEKLYKDKIHKDGSGKDTPPSATSSADMFMHGSPHHKMEVM